MNIIPLTWFITWCLIAWSQRGNVSQITSMVKWFLLMQRSDHISIFVILHSALPTTDEWFPSPHPPQHVETGKQVWGIINEYFYTCIYHWWQKWHPVWAPSNAPDEIFYEKHSLLNHERLLASDFIKDQLSTHKKLRGKLMGKYIGIFLKGISGRTAKVPHQNYLFTQDALYSWSWFSTKTMVSLKTLDTIGNYQRLAFTVGVSQHVN